jgi:hypothetical protein
MICQFDSDIGMFLDDTWSNIAQFDQGSHTLYDTCGGELFHMPPPQINSIHLMVMNAF